MIFLQKRKQKKIDSVARSGKKPVIKTKATHTPLKARKSCVSIPALLAIDFAVAGGDGDLLPVLLPPSDNRAALGAT